MRARFTHLLNVLSQRCPDLIFSETYGDFYDKQETSWYHVSGRYNLGDILRDLIGGVGFDI